MISDVAQLNEGGTELVANERLADSWEDAVVAANRGASTRFPPDAMLRLDQGINDLKAQLAAQDAVIEKTMQILRDIFALIESGVLVRDISNDDKPGWAMQALELMMILKRAQETIALAASGDAKKKETL